VWINRCGVLAGAGQFGRADQGIFAYWLNSWLRRAPLKYIGFDGRGSQVRDVLHPRDLLPLLEKQFASDGRGKARLQNVSGGAASARSLAQLSAWRATPTRARLIFRGWYWIPPCAAGNGTGNRPRPPKKSLRR
jgi:CDP-paratose 2-epimerase